MKKILLGLFLLSSMSFANAITLYGGFDFNGELESKTGGVRTTDDAEEISYEIGIENHVTLLKNYGSKVEVGTGMKLESSIILDDNSNDTYATTLPVYLSGKVSMNLQKGIALYTQGRVGYNFVFKGDILKDQNKDVDGGLYTSIGIGLKIEDLDIGLSYGVSRFSTENSAGVNTDHEYSKTALTVGYEFQGMR